MTYLPQLYRRNEKRHLKVYLLYVYTKENSDIETEAKKKICLLNCIFEYSIQNTKKILAIKNAILIFQNLREDILAGWQNSLNFWIIENVKLNLFLKMMKNAYACQYRLI